MKIRDLTFRHRLVKLNLAACCIVTLSVALSTVGAPSQKDDTVRIHDNSDWWSSTRNSGSSEEITSEPREFANSTFQVLGIELNNTMFTRTTARLGKATEVQRGDTSTGRLQACYVSSEGKEKIYLIFEQDEVDYTFYLFAGGAPWEGSDYCVASRAISRDLITASGLRLGQTPAQVIAILGKPTKRHNSELIYSFSVRKKATVQDLGRARQQHPQMSEREIQDNFGSYDLGAGVYAKFTNSKLTYLTVSKGETN